jgi:hypothetical protein
VRCVPLGFGSGVVRAVAMASHQRAMEDPIGAGGFERVGAPRVDSPATACPLEGQSESPRGQGGEVRRAGGEDLGRSAQPVSSAALGVGGHRCPATAVAATAGPTSLPGCSGVGGSQPEVSGVWPARGTAGGAGLAIGRAALGMSRSTPGVECGPAGALVGSCGQQRSFSGVAVGESAQLGVGDFE